MRRRTLLAAATAGSVGLLGGCGSLDSPGDCAGETYTGIEYSVDLRSIERTTGGDWRVRAVLSVDMNYVSELGNPGLLGAGIAFYEESGEHVETASVGSMRWTDVPESNRSVMSCGDFERGALSRERTVTLEAFPAYVGPWYSRVKAGVTETAHGLRYDGGTGTARSTDTFDWTRVNLQGRRTLPPVPEASATLGPGVATARLQPGRERCGGVETPGVGDADPGRCCPYTVEGRLPLAGSGQLIALSAATVSEDGSVATVKLRRRPYRRPPGRSCESPYRAYGLELGVNAPVAEIAVVHTDSEGAEIERDTVTTG